MPQLESNSHAYNIYWKNSRLHKITNLSTSTLSFKGTRIHFSPPPPPTDGPLVLEYRAPPLPIHTFLVLTSLRRRASALRNTYLHCHHASTPRLHPSTALHLHAPAALHLLWLSGDLFPFSLLCLGQSGLGTCWQHLGLQQLRWSFFLIALRLN